MDNYELKPERKVKKKSPIWNVLTVLVLLATCGLAYYFVNIFMDPYSPLNLFPPVALPTAFQTETYTPTIKPLDPTWTYTYTIKPSPSRTKAPTWTLLPELITPEFTFTPTETPDLGTPTTSATPMAANAAITYLDGTVVHPDTTCDWMGVGGSVVDSEGKPVVFQTVQLSGTLNGKAINKMVLSGTTTQEPFGPAGFEFLLGNKALDTSQELWIILFDNTGKALSPKIYLDTFSDCTKNLALVSFTINR
jgi:hypothetical protein